MKVEISFKDGYYTVYDRTKEINVIRMFSNYADLSDYLFLVFTCLYCKNELE